MWKWCVAFMLIGAVSGRGNIPVSRHQRLSEVMKEQGNKYDNPHNINLAEAGVLATVDSFTDQIDENAVSEMSLVGRDEIKETFIALAKSECKAKSSFFDMFNETAPCMDPGSHNDAKKTLQELDRYICDNDAQIFTEFINDGALTCMERQASAIKQCIRQTTALADYRTTLSVAESCTQYIYNQVTTCIVGTLSECPKPSTAALVARIFHDLSKGFRCNSDTIKQIDEDKGSDNAI